jgi:pilus assembly protein Flp/PilA
MTKLTLCFKRLVNGEGGATIVEYGLMLALVAIVAIAGAAFLGTQSSTLFSTVGNTL